MKKFLLIIILIPVLLSAQLNILFVDDDALNYGNSDTLLTAILAAGYEYTYFNAPDSGRSPGVQLLQEYDVVLWHTATDGVDLYFWDGADTINQHITDYLNWGGNLWLMGNDFLYDRHGAPPQIFIPGSFEHDYLGIFAFNVQSYGDDGGLGVSELNLVPGQNITSLDPVHFVFPALWWVDGCTETDAAVAVYQMGPDSYLLSGETTSIYNPLPSGSVLTFFFDPAQIDHFSNRVHLFSDVLSYFENYVSQLDVPIETGKNSFNLFSNYPNPFNPQTSILFSMNSAETVSFNVYNISGQLVTSLAEKAWYPAGRHQIIWEPVNLSGGIYFIRMETEHFKSTRKVIYLK